MTDNPGPGLRSPAPMSTGRLAEAGFFLTSVPATDKRRIPSRFEGGLSQDLPIGRHQPG